MLDFLIFYLGLRRLGIDSHGFKSTVFGIPSSSIIVKKSRLSINVYPSLMLDNEILTLTMQSDKVRLKMDAECKR